jgi:hypothetical protein
MAGSCQRGQIMVATQRIHVGMIHARKIVTVTADDHSVQLDIDGSRGFVSWFNAAPRRIRCPAPLPG